LIQLYKFADKLLGILILVYISHVYQLNTLSTKAWLCRRVCAGKIFNRAKFTQAALRSLCEIQACRPQARASRYELVCTSKSVVKLERVDGPLEAQSIPGP
jgi:hypothetical protein